MGHEWTNFVYHATLFKYITVWPFMPLDDMIQMKSLFSQSASNISDYNQVVANWLPAESIRAKWGDQLVPFTPILYDTYVVFPSMPKVIKTHCICGSIALVTGFA